MAWAKDRGQVPSADRPANAFETLTAKKLQLLVL